MARGRRVMLWLGVVLGIVVGIPLLGFVVGSFLPRDHVARMTIVLNAPPERIWGLVSDVGGTARWRPDVTQIEVLPSAAGASRFVEATKRGKVTFEVVSQDPPRRQVIRVVDDDQPFGGTWTWEIEPEGGGARLTITEAGFIKNPLFRVMGKVFFPPTAAMDAYLRALAQELGDSAAPAEVPGG